MSTSAVLEQIGITESNTHLVCESLCSVRPDWNYWQERVTIQTVSLCPVFEKLASLMRMDKHSSSLWVPLQCLSRPEPLMRMGEYPTSLWVIFSVWAIEPLTRLGEHPLHPGRELLFSVWADQHHWWEHINIHPVCKSCPVFDKIRTTDEMVQSSSKWVSLQFLSRL